jgi:hypothetical protein
MTLTMKPEKKKRFFLKHRFPIIPVLTIILFLNCSADVPIQARESLDAAASDKLILFVIHMNSLMCFPCINPFLDFYDRIPSSLRESRVWVVVVYEALKKKDGNNRHQKIIQKQFRGFLQANNIECPIVLDSFHNFKELSRGGTALLVFDKKKKSVKKYVFPLKKKQMQEILSSLRD